MAQATIGGMTATQTTAGVQARLEHVYNSLHDSFESLRTQADRINGPSATTPGTTGKPPAPIASTINSTLSDIEELTSRITVEVGRIANAL